MGGVAGGDIAAETTTRRFVGAIEEGLSPNDAVDSAHRKVISVADSDVGVRGMGATLCAGVFGTNDLSPALALVNVGDSRAYLLRKGDHVRQLTRDQRWVQAQMDAGVLSPEEARFHRNRSILTSVVGAPDAYSPSIEFIKPEIDDQYLFCTDGISDEISDQALEELISKSDNHEQLARQLIEHVLEGAAKDNATVVVVSVLGAPK
jgi:protein phosphatase